MQGPAADQQACRHGADADAASSRRFRVCLSVLSVAALAFLTLSAARASLATRSPVARATQSGAAAARALSGRHGNLLGRWVPEAEGPSGDEADGAEPATAGGAPGTPERRAAEEEPRSEENDGAAPLAAGGNTGGAAEPRATGEKPPANVVWTQEPQPYYSWIWADVAIRPDPLDLGHGGADPESAHWSPWLSRQAAVQDLQLYRTADNYGRPLEMRMAAAKGNFPAAEVEKQLLPGSKRFLSKFESVEEAINYLTGRGTDAVSSTTSLAPLPATARVQGASEVQSKVAPEQQAAPGSATHGHMMSYFMMAVVGFLVCLASVAVLGYFTGARVFRVRLCRSSGEDESESEDELEQGLAGAGANPWQAFMDAPREGEMRRLLVFIEQGPQELPPLPPLPQLGDDDCRAAAGPSQRRQAEAEVERIVAMRDVREIFGAGDAAARKQEFRRLLRLIHPDKGLVFGQRAALALRRVVESYRMQAGGD